MNARYRSSPVALVVNTHHAVRRALCDRIRASFANVQLWEAGSMEDALSLIDRSMRRVVEPGAFEILIGTSSATTLTAKLEVAAR